MIQMATFTDSNGKVHSCKLCVKYPDTPECLEQCPSSPDPQNSGGTSSTPGYVWGLSLAAGLVVLVVVVLAVLWWYRRKRAPPPHHNIEAPVQEQADLLTKPKYMVNHANTQTHDPLEAEQRPLAAPVENDCLPIRESAEGTSISASPHVFT